MSSITSISFRPDLIVATDTKGGTNGALSLGITMREDKPYLRWMISNGVARSIGLRAGSRVSFGVSEDRRAAVIAPSPGGGWKLTKQGEHSLMVMVVADKLGIQASHGRPLESQSFIRYDSQLVVDLSNFTNQA